MLVITRKKNEELKIGDDITIKIIRCGLSSIKIGIDAPRDVSVTRPEVEDRNAA